MEKERVGQRPNIRVLVPRIDFVLWAIHEVLCSVCDSLPSARICAMIMAFFGVKLPLLHLVSFLKLGLSMFDQLNTFLPFFLPFAT